MRARSARNRSRRTGTRSPVAGDAGDGDVVAADHEVDVDRAAVAAGAVLLRQALVRAVAERDVAGGVLVEQACRRRRFRAGRRDPRDPRGRPRRAGPRRRRTPPVHASRAAPCSASISTARPPSNRTSRPADDRSVAEHERLRRADVPVRPLRVGRRVDLLGRQVREVHDPVDGLVARRVEGRRRQQPDRQVGPGPLEVQRVEPPLVQPLGRRGERVGPLVPGGDRVGLVEPADVGDLLPQPVERLLGRRDPDRRAAPTACSGTARPSSSSCGRR